MLRSDNDDRIVGEDMFSLDESDVAGTSIICLPMTLTTMKTIKNATLSRP